MLCFLISIAPHQTTNMLTGKNKIPVYVLLSREDARGVFDVLAEAWPITKEASYSGKRSVPEAIHHASNLDKDQWYQRYIIIVDRPQWKSLDGVLVINMDFEGDTDGESDCKVLQFVDTCPSNTGIRAQDACIRGRYQHLFHEHRKY